MQASNAAQENVKGVKDEAKKADDAVKDIQGDIEAKDNELNTKVGIGIACCVLVCVYVCFVLR